MKFIPSLLLLASAATASAVDYEREIKPIFNQKCYACHAVSKGKTKGDVALDTPEELAKVIKPDGQIIPGDPAKSTLLSICKLPDDDSDVMPPKGKNRLTDAEVATLEGWIKEGASLTGGGAPAPAPAMAAGGVQTWTSSDGRTLQATYVGAKDGGVMLKMASNGEVFLVPLSRLSPESQQQARAAAGQ